MLWRLCGKQGCPKVIDESCVNAYYKYETSSRSFKLQGSTVHINNTTGMMAVITVYFFFNDATYNLRCIVFGHGKDEALTQSVTGTGYYPLGIIMVGICISYSC